MKRVYLFLCMLAAIATFTACSSDDAVNDEPSIGSEANAYMNVKISLTGNSTRAASRAATSEGYETSTTDAPDEYTVESARFLFFDVSGNYKTMGNTLTNPTQTAGKNGNNIESTIGQTVVLGPTTIDGPLKMVTFLNYDADKFNDLIGKSFDDVLAATTDKAPEKSGDFEMTSSAYIGNTTEGETSSTTGVVQYTYVPTSYFYTTSEAAVSEGQYVDAYVERSVAKVALSMPTTTADAASASSTTPFTGYVYPIKRAGDSETANASTFTVDNANGKLAVQVLGWTVNGYNNKGYMVKHISNTGNTDGTGPYYYIQKTQGTTQASKSEYALNAWTLENATFNGSAWNNSTDHRSYWAEDANYGTDSENFSTSTDTDNTRDLVYKSFDEFYDGETKQPTYQYVYENTVAQAQAWYKGGEQNPNVTTMLILGKIGKWDSSNSTAPFTATDEDDYIFRINGAYYTSDYIKSLLASKYYTTAYSAGSTQTNLGTDAIGFVENSSTASTPNVEIDLTTLTGDDVTKKQTIGNIAQFTVTLNNTTLYEEGGTTSVEDGAVASYLLTALHATNTDVEIECYKNGYCYYQVPIEQPAPESTETGKSNAIYGVVRNHSYQLTLSSLTNIGDPIFKTDKKLEPIPGSDDYYYVGAKINVLAWRKVIQNIDL